MLDGWRKMDPPTQKVTCRGGCCGTLVDKALNGKSNKHKHERAACCGPNHDCFLLSLTSGRIYSEGRARVHKNQVQHRRSHLR